MSVFIRSFHIPVSGTMPPKKKAKGPRTPEKPSSASGGSSENWRCVSAQDYFAYVNRTCDDDVDKLHPWISDGKMEGYACRDCEMHGYHDSYHVLSASQVEAVMLLVEGAKPTKSRKTKGHDQDADDVNDDQRGGDPKDIRRVLSNANLNIKRTDLNRKRRVERDLGQNALDQALQHHERQTTHHRQGRHSSILRDHSRGAQGPGAVL